MAQFDSIVSRVPPCNRDRRFAKRKNSLNPLNSFQLRGLGSAFRKNIHRNRSYYESQGRGEAVVFIPGTGFSGNVWTETQVEPLSRSLQVIVHDPRGCGRSTHFKGVCTIDQMANDVAALLEHLNVRSAHIIGHSMGGRIGLSLALNFPGKVKSLILAAAGSGPAAREGAETVPGLPIVWPLNS